MKKKKQCPKCKSEKVLEIMYGLPVDPSNLPKDVYLGGCCISGNDPEWHCGDCDWEWGRNCEGGYNK